jgi:hypothetical protein
MTRWPRAASAFGRLPHTSPRPPVLLYGAACTAVFARQTAGLNQKLVRLTAHSGEAACLPEWRRLHRNWLVSPHPDCKRKGLSVHVAAHVAQAARLAEQRRLQAADWSCSHITRIDDVESAVAANAAEAARRPEWPRLHTADCLESKHSDKQSVWPRASSWLLTTRRVPARVATAPQECVASALPHRLKSAPGALLQRCGRVLTMYFSGA